MSVILYDIKALDVLINNQCRDHINISNRVDLGDDRITPELVDYMNSTDSSKKYYAEKDFEKLKIMYLGELTGISDYFRNLDNRKKLITYMELMRLSSMYEAIGERAAVLSQEGLKVGLVGKGVCMAQASFLRDLCIVSGMKAGVRKIQSQDSIHAITVVSDKEGECIIFDPTVYNGSANSVNSACKYKKFDDLNCGEVINLSVTNDEIKEARHYVLRFLVEKFKINEISENIGLSDYEIDEKVLRIVAYLESLVVPSMNANFRSIELNGKELELGKMIELLFSANNIKYDVIPTNKKADSFLQIELFGHEIIMNPKKMYSQSNNWLVCKIGDNYEKVSNNPTIQGIIDEKISQHRLDLNKKSNNFKHN